MHFSQSTDMMSVLYNFVKVDNDTFLSDPKHLEMVATMCKTVSTDTCRIYFITDMC